MTSRTAGSSSIELAQAVVDVRRVSPKAVDVPSLSFAPTVLVTLS
jgi:hypothetical protein